METLEIQLERVQKAIAAIEEGAQEYEIGGSGSRRRVRRADLPILYRRESDLKAAIGAQSGGDVTYAQMGKA